MPEFKIAHIREQGQDLIIAPLEPRFGRMGPHAQNEQIMHLQRCAESAGLAGTVVPMWEENGRPRFIAPRPWHPYFEGLSLVRVAQMLNRRLTCR